MSDDNGAGRAGVEAMPSPSRIVDALGESTSSSRELQDFHNNWYNDDGTENTELYGSPDAWSPIKRSGHYRRMAVLEAFAIPGLAEKVAADFGVGPWGFACVFPKLRTARHCYGFDVSSKALEITAKVDAEIADKTSYFTSDGETIPIDDDMIDVFWGGEVIEHVRSPARFLQEIARVCVDGADVFLSTPNRDAIYYAARGEDYTIGPEHIALMNFTELQVQLGRFLTDVTIVGYETSLSPELDATITKEATLALIQDRAYVHP